MNYYDLVEDKNMAKHASLLGYDRIISINEVNAIVNPEYTEAIKNPGSLLIDPLNERKTLVDPALAKKMAEKNGVVMISLKGIASREGMKRAGWIHSIILTLRICKKYNVEVVIGSFASGPEGLKTPRMLEAVGQSLGLTKPQARWACTNAWKKVFRE